MNIITDETFKYDHENLDPASEEFTFLKKTFMATFFGLYHSFNNFHICKVNERNFVKTPVKPTNNLMLFHGTSQKRATSILKEGFRNSEKGWFGKGVYMTDCSELAFDYANSRFNADFSGYVIFVNEVLESEKLQTFTFDRNAMFIRGDLSTLPKHQFEKHTDNSRPQSTENDYIVDFEGRRYFKSKIENMQDEFIAEASVVIPRYLIELKKK